MLWPFLQSDMPKKTTSLKGLSLIRVSKLQGIDLFSYVLDLRELVNSNDMNKSLVGALF